MGIDKLDDQILADTSSESIGDEILEAAEDARHVILSLVSFVDRIAQAARRSIAHIRWLLAGACLVGLVTVVYFVGVRGWTWAFTGVPLFLILVPGIVVLVGERMLAAVANLPAQLIGMDDALAEVAREYAPQIKAFEEHKLRGLLKWRSYILLAKILFKLRTLSDQSNRLFRSLGMLVFVVNPFFWVVVLVAIGLLLIECVVMLGLCLGFMLFG